MEREREKRRRKNLHTVRPSNKIKFGLDWFEIDDFRPVFAPFLAVCIRYCAILVNAGVPGSTTTKGCYDIRRHGGGLGRVVIVHAFTSDDIGSRSRQFFCKILMKKNENKAIGPFKN